MLSKFRSFSKSKFAPVLVAMIAIPFMFWGMGGMFSSGNTNTIAKINNHNISTEKFTNFINTSEFNKKYIRENLDKGILENLLNELVSNTLIELEVKKLGVTISEKSLAKKITENKNFHDSNSLFSRIKYEKFLLQNNTSATQFEMQLKINELRKQLFTYIGGGLKPPSFVVNKNYEDKNKKIKIKYLNLNNVYKKDFTNKEIEDFISKNKENLKRDLINISYVKLTPQNLIDSNEFNELFFKKIDEIDNMVLNGSKIDQIKNQYNLKITKINDYYIKETDDDVLKEIFAKRKLSKIELVEKNDYYLLYQISNYRQELPSVSDKFFYNKVKKEISQNEINSLHKNILIQIQNKKMNDNSFNKIAQNKDQIKEIQIKSINDTGLFEKNSINLMYSLPKNSYLLIADENKKIYLAKIVNIENTNFENFADNKIFFYSESKNSIKNSLFKSYDLYLNSKYKVKVNEKAFDRITNYFK